MNTHKQTLQSRHQRATSIQPQPVNVQVRLALPFEETLRDVSNTYDGRHCLVGEADFAKFVSTPFSVSFFD